MLRDIAGCHRLIDQKVLVDPGDPCTPGAGESIQLLRRIWKRVLRSPGLFEHPFPHRAPI